MSKWQAMYDKAATKYPVLEAGLDLALPHRPHGYGVILYLMACTELIK